MKPLGKPLSGVALALVCVGAASVGQAGIAYHAPAGGWDYMYEGADDAFGSGGFTALDGTWCHEGADWWDGSAPGDPLGTAPACPAPGGAGALPEDETWYLRIQDTGRPEWFRWCETNKKIYFAHNITSDPGNETATSVLTAGITISIRARIAASGPLDGIYPPYGRQAPWPAGGKGYGVNSDGRGMFGVGQDGASCISFGLVLDSDTPAGIGGGLVMNNQRFSVATANATPETVNLVPLTDAELIDWHEFWITIQDTDADSQYEIDVYRDGSRTPDSFLATASCEAEHPGQNLVMGLSSGNDYGAVDVDFFGYRLGVSAPVPEPSTLVMSLMVLSGLMLACARFE